MDNDENWRRRRRRKRFAAAVDCATADKRRRRSAFGAAKISKDDADCSSQSLNDEKTLDAHIVARKRRTKGGIRERKRGLKGGTWRKYDPVGDGSFYSPKSKKTNRRRL